MPNWCENNLIIEGNKKDIKKFKEKVKKDNECFQLHSLIPPPEEMIAIDENSQLWKDYDKIQEHFKKKYGSPNSYLWNVNNLGCKWDVANPELVRAGPTELEYSFETPWGPPGIGVVNISRLFPRLLFTLEYDEPGMDFWGKCVIKNGKTIEQEDGISKINESQRES